MTDLVVAFVARRFAFVTAAALLTGIACGALASACSGNRQQDTRTAADVQRVVCGFLESEVRAGRLKALAPEVESLCPAAAELIHDIGAVGAP